jgi:ATP-dependent RNA helicase DDX60
MCLVKIHFIQRVSIKSTVDVAPDHHDLTFFPFAVVLQQALAASNDPDDTKHFIHEPEGQATAFGSALRRIQKTQRCFPTVTDEQMTWMCDTTLEEFCNNKESGSYLALSTSAIIGLGYVHSDLTLAMDHNALTTIWELHDYLPESVYIGAVLEQMYIRFCYRKTKVYKESDATQNEFLSVLLHVVDRHPPINGQESLQQLLRIVPHDGKAVDDDAKALWVETENRLHNQSTLIQSLDIDQNEKDRILLVLPAATAVDGVGPPLDKGVYEMLVSKQKGFLDEQSTERRNELKNRIVRLGQICRIVHNNIQQPHGKYSELEVHFRRMFSNIKYSVHDMMTQLTDQTDVSDI